MIAIQTTYQGATNNRQSRIRVTVCAPHETLPPMFVKYSHELSGPNNHHAAAAQYLARLGWDKHQWISGETRTGYVYCAHRPESVLQSAFPLLELPAQKGSAR